MMEPPRKKNGNIQCIRCQEDGHTKSYCVRPFKCVKSGNLTTLKHAQNENALRLHVRCVTKTIPLTMHKSCIVNFHRLL